MLRKSHAKEGWSHEAGHMSLYGNGNIVSTTMSITKTPKAHLFLCSLESSFRSIVLAKLHNVRDTVISLFNLQKQELREVIYLHARKGVHYWGFWKKESYFNF